MSRSRLFSLILLALAFGLLGPTLVATHKSAPPDPVSVCQTALRQGGWQVSSSGGLISAKKQMDWSQWQMNFLATNQALEACNRFPLMSGCLGQGCDLNQSTLRFSTIQRP